MASKQENLIHLKFDYSEGKRAKRDILSSEADILKLSKIISTYKELRLQELKNKMILHSKLKSLNRDISIIERYLPKLKIPKILKKEEEIKQNEVPIKAVTKYGTIEDQLREIQEKLKSLED